VEDLLYKSHEHSFLNYAGCWWGVTAEDHANKIEIAFRVISPPGRIFMSSSPTMVIQTTSSIASKLLMWWEKAKRHAAKHFWGESASSVPLFLIVTVLKAERFVSCNGPFLEIGKEGRIGACGYVDEETGKLSLQTVSKWHLDDNEHNLFIRESDKQQTCCIGFLDSRMFRLEDELRELGRKVWE
jgi:hypothetical protein